MPIETQKELIKENPFSAAKPMDDIQTYKITLDRKSEGRNIELHFKGPGSQEELEKALKDGKIPSGWEVTVVYGKKGKAYSIDDSTLFDNYLKGTDFERTDAGTVKTSLSGADSTFSGARSVSFAQVRDSTDAGAKKVESNSYRDSSNSGATKPEYTVSKPDSSSSGAAKVGYSKVKVSPSSGAQKTDYSSHTDSPTSGAVKVKSSAYRDPQETTFNLTRDKTRRKEDKEVAEND